MRHVGPTQIIKKKKNKKKRKKRRREEVLFFYFYFFFFSRFSLRYTEIGPSKFVEGRSKVMYSTRATHRNQKHVISPSFYLKFGKSYVLVFLRSTAFCRSELVGAEGQIDPHIASYAWVPKFWSFVKLLKVWIFT